MIKIPLAIYSLKKGYVYIYAKNMKDLYALMGGTTKNDKLRIAINGNYFGETTLDTKYYRILITKKIASDLLDVGYNFVELRKVKNYIDLAFVK